MPATRSTRSTLLFLNIIAHALRDAIPLRGVLFFRHLYTWHMVVFRVLLFSLQPLSFTYSALDALFSHSEAFAEFQMTWSCCCNAALLRSQQRDYLVCVLVCDSTIKFPFPLNIS